MNTTLWKERGIIVYSETKEVNNAVSVTSGSNYKDGQYRYWGYDINGGLYGNDDFPRDSDSGTPAYEKDWLTTEEIKESAVARGYIGEHGLSANGRYTTADKTKTAKAWLDENPAWKSAGIDETYIVKHFYFNSVLTDEGLTTGQFTGVHISKHDGKLYYQSFAVQGEIPTFLITEGTIKERVLIDHGDMEEEPEEPIEGAEVMMDVELGLPMTTYVGHPVTATDRSAFHVNGEARSATRVYAEGLASNSFSVISGDGSIRKNSSIPTKAQATFTGEGNAAVRLTVSTQDGGTGYDTKSIEVLETPHIEHNLNGVQKQNRKQVLNLWVATDPKRPLEEFWVELRDAATGESVTLVHHVGTEVGMENTLVNSDMIKTRPIRGLASDMYFTNCELEFLTKNPEERDFEYTVFVKDREGNSDQVTKGFTVMPDLAPEAAIDLERTYLRLEGENRAKIDVEDVSRSDGDQLERTWSYADMDGESEPAESDYIDVKDAEGYEDLSFGMGKNVGFEKEGVGKFRMKLRVKDVWTEPTLEEYVTEEERRFSETTMDAEVVNVAPKVSLEPLSMKSAELLFLTTDAAVRDQIESQLTEVSAMLLEGGIDGKITAEQIRPVESSEGIPWEKTIEVDTPYGYQGSWIELFEKENFIADHQRLYKIDATWLSSASGNYPQSPYTITAWDGETGTVDWTYTFTSDIFTVPDSGAFFTQDDTGSYLYFVANGKTLLLDKKTGSHLATLPYAVGSSCFVANEWIFTVKTDGVYRIHMGTGQMTKIYNGIMAEGSARFEGDLQCVIRSGPTLYRGRMDLESQEMKLQVLEEGASASGKYEAERFCTDGSLLVKEINGSNIKFTLYDKKGEIIGSHSQVASEMDAVAAHTGSGNEECVVYVVNEKVNSSKYKTTLTCANLRTGITASTSLTNANGDPAMARIVAAEQVGDKVYGVAGAYASWITNYGWANGPTHGYPQRTRTALFEMSTGTASVISNETIQLDEKKEYGDSSDVYAVIQSAQNGQYQDPPSGNITTLYRRKQTVEEAQKRLEAKYIDLEGNSDLCKTFVLDAADLTAEPLAELVDRQLDYESMDQTRYVQIKGREEDGLLWRELLLQPDTTYYYEYDLYQPVEGDMDEPKDIFVAEAQIGRTTEEFLTGKQYRVVQTIEEHFDNNRLGHEYFTGAAISTLDNDRWQAKITSLTGKIKSTETTMSFVVEEGQTAVLSFDYIMNKHDAEAELADYVAIDGVRWKMPLNKIRENKGHYTHPFLLGSGAHTITLVARAYGESTSLLAIDDLKVEYIEEGAPTLDPIR
ncbi:MAG: hypothetical protein IKD13_07705, partial [Firmicutes bacterium]|nr:hypothetical protein [Bacillota bacterium]